MFIFSSSFYSNARKSCALFIEFLFSNDIFLQGKIFSHSPLPSTPPQNQKNPPENVCTLPNMIPIMIRVKVSRSLGIIRKLRYTFPGSILKLLFFCLVQSYVSYCPIVWMSTFSSKLRSLSVMHNKARRLVMDTNCSSPTSLLSLRSIYNIFYASFVFDQLHGNLPKSVRKTSIFVFDSALYSLRSSNNI